MDRGVPDQNLREMDRGVPDQNLREMDPGVPDQNLREMGRGVPDQNLREMGRGAPDQRVHCIFHCFQQVSFYVQTLQENEVIKQINIQVYKFKAKPTGKITV